MPVEKCTKLGKLRAQFIDENLEKMLNDINDPVIVIFDQIFILNRLILFIVSMQQKMEIISQILS